MNEFVSVKYASSADGDTNQTLNYLIGASFVLMLVQLYRSKHSGGKTGGTGSGGSKTPLGRGGGGMSDMMGMGKSNV